MPPQAPSASAAPLRRHRAREDRQRQRHHDRAAEALHGAGEVQRLDRRRERGRDRAEREDADADREHPPAAEAVAERGAGQEQHRERQRVGVDRPLEALERRVQVRADHGDRGRDDEVVERDHEERDRGDRERPQTSSSWPASIRSFLWLVTSYFHVKAKKRRPLAPASQPRDQPVAPTASGRSKSRIAAEHVQEHALREERADDSPAARRRRRSTSSTSSRQPRPARPRGRRGRRRPRSTGASAAEPRRGPRSAPSYASPIAFERLLARACPRDARCERLVESRSMQRAATRR